MYETIRIFFCTCTNLFNFIGTYVLVASNYRNLRFLPVLVQTCNFTGSFIVTIFGRKKHNSCRRIIALRFIIDCCCVFVTTAIITMVLISSTITAAAIFLFSIVYGIATIINIDNKSSNFLFLPTLILLFFTSMVVA